MAQTKTSASQRRGSSTSARARSNKTSRNRSNASRTRGASRARSSSGSSGAESVKETVTSGAQDAAQGVATFAKNAKTPLLTGGAALAGVAGAAVLTARSRRRRKVLGVPLPKRNGLKVDAQKVTEAIADAAKRADRLGQRVSRVANGVQEVSETAKKS